jgi:glycosyltransferase involved in cell wall biosynthesis
MANISVIIHTHNEEKNIKDCITSARLISDDITVIDMDSTDKTVELAKSEKVTVTNFPFSTYVEPARAFGIARALADWIFILDADERMTKELASEIKSIISNEQPTTNNRQLITHYKVSRKNIFGKKKWLTHGGWSPDFQMRFINKKYFKSWPKEIHSTPKIDGEIGYLKNSFLHYFHGDLEKMVDKTTIFEDIESDLLYKAGRPVKTSTFFRKFFGELFRRLIKNGGFWDGPIGIIESIYQAYSKTITYLYLYEKKNSRTV